MAFFDARFDVGSIDELERKLARLPRPVENEVRKSNRKWASKLRDFIRQKAAVLLNARDKQGGRHDTRSGALAKAVKSSASGKNAKVYGNNTAAAPHFAVQEYGGSVFWHNSNPKVGGHAIPIGNRVNVETNKSGNRRGAEGKFFNPTAREEAPLIAERITESAIKIVHEMLSQG